MLQIFTIMSLTLAVSLVNAQAISVDGCGDPPANFDQKITGELKGKAQLLSKYFGNAELSGKIEIDRKEVLSKYPNAGDLLLNRMFQYQVCYVLMADKSIPTLQKIQEMQKIQESFKRDVKKVGYSSTLIRSLFISWDEMKREGCSQARKAALESLKSECGQRYQIKADSCPDVRSEIATYVAEVVAVCAA